MFLFIYLFMILMKCFHVFVYVILFYLIYFKILINYIMWGTKSLCLNASRLTPRLTNTKTSRLTLSPLKTLNTVCKLLSVRIDLMRKGKTNQIHCMPWNTSVNNFKRSLLSRMIRHTIKSKLNLWKGSIPLIRLISTNGSYRSDI